MKSGVLIIGGCALLALVVCGEIAQAKTHSLRQEWLSYKTKYGKSYESPEEDARRFARFTKSKAVVESHNVKAGMPHQLELNHLADWTEEELGRGRDMSLIARAIQNTPEGEQFLQAIFDDPAPVPDELDWRNVPGRVNPKVINQHKCECSWAAAAVGVLEGQQAARLNASSVTPLSVQQLLDCTGAPYQDCNSGAADVALVAAGKLGGVMSNQSYPYEQKKGKECKFSKDKVVMANKGAVRLPWGDEEKMRIVVAKYGPVSAMIMGECVYFYARGIYDNPSCSKIVSSSVLIVGYGTDPLHGDYWIAKTSYGEKWGEKGYMKLRRGFDMISIADYPVIASF